MDLVAITFCTQQVINLFMLTKTCYIFSTLSNNCFHELISVFIPSFIRSAVEKTEQKNIKNEEMSMPYKWLPIEGGFKPSAHWPDLICIT